MADLKPAKVGSETMTKLAVEKLRDDVIKWRDASFEQWPDAIPFTVAATHLIALLAWVIEIYPEDNRDA